MSFALYLQSCGHIVVAVDTVTDALMIWPLAPHDVLISDLRLPDGDGWALLGLLSPRPRYAIAATGLGTAADRARSRVAGYRHHLLKPFNLTELDGFLQQAMRELPSLRPDHHAEAA